MATLALNESELRSALIEEYKLLYQRWDDFDRRALTMKGWSTAGIAIALSASQGQNSMFCLFMIFVIFSIWLLEGIWKSWQHAYGPRMNEIENYFQSGGMITPLQMGQSWGVHYFQGKPDRTNICLMLKEMRRLSVMMPYLVFIVYLIFVIFGSRYDNILSAIRILAH